MDKAFLIGVRSTGMDEAEAREHIDELAELVDTLGLELVGREMAMPRLPHPRYLIGSGKATELSKVAKEAGADCLVVDADLSPAQQRNWERLDGLRTLDRQEVILEIFASRAWTREAELQVALARLEYTLPRLKRAWTHLSRQQGGVAGTRGEGETQLEYDRRMVVRKIAALKKDLLEVEKRRHVQRSQRFRNKQPVAAIVGYTNVGKSSLLNAIAGADAYVQDKLFATLDPTTRALILPDRRKILLTDTVGLIRKLPHALVAAFKSTLEEASLADQIIHVLDASSPRLDDQYATTIQLLDELEASKKPTIIVYNKIDLVSDPVVKARLMASKPGAICVSAKTGEGLDLLKYRLMGLLGESEQIITLRFPNERHDLLARLYERRSVLSVDYDGTDILVKARQPEAGAAEFAPFKTS